VRNLARGKKKRRFCGGDQRRRKKKKRKIKGKNRWPFPADFYRGRSDPKRRIQGPEGKTLCPIQKKNAAKGPDCTGEKG